MSKIKDFSRTPKTSPTVFKDLKLMKNTDLSFKTNLRNARLTLVNVNAPVVATTSWWLHFTAPVVA